MQNISVVIKKYSLPILFSVLGIMLIYLSLTSEQPIEFIIASIIILVCSIFLFLTVSGSVSNKITNIIGGLSLLLSSFAFYTAYNSVGDSINHIRDYALMKGLSIRNLKDIQIAQKEFKKKYGYYASDWNTIIDFIEKDSIADIVRKGSVPNRKITEKERDYLIQFGLYKKGQAIDNKMTDLEAYYLSKSDICPPELVTFKRDTIMVSFIETSFTKNKTYIDERIKYNYGKFDAKKLRYIPFTNEKKEWKMGSEMVRTKSDGKKDSVYYFRLEGILPLAENEGAKPEEIMSLGSLKDLNLSGSWEDEEIIQELELKNRKFIQKTTKIISEDLKTDYEKTKISDNTEGDKSKAEKSKSKKPESIKSKGKKIKGGKTGDNDNGRREIKSKIRIEFEKVFAKERKKRIDSNLDPDKGTFTFRGKLYTTEMATLN